MIDAFELEKVVARDGTVLIVCGSVEGKKKKEYYVTVIETEAVLPV